MHNQKKYILLTTAIVISVLVYAFMAYWLDRSHFIGYITGMTMAFVSYVVLYRSFSLMRLCHVLTLAIGFRLIFLCSLPTLSDDYHRYIWDGRLITAGQSPYEFTPNAVPDSTQSVIDPAGQLRYQMNSQNYYSIYPPLHQGVFLLSAWLGSGTIQATIVMRLILLLSEVLFIFFLYKISVLTDRPRAFALYSFNPLVISEISGNLHFEGVIAFLLLAGLWALHSKRHLVSGFLIGTAAAVKLTPLIYFPALINYIPDHRLKVRWILVAFCTFGLAGWWIFPLDQWLHLGSSIGLYFESFEFNASFYYLARSVGMYWLGYNPIAITGWLLPVTGMTMILGLSYFWRCRKIQSVADLMVIVGTIYLLFATTVHPWYIIPLVSMSVLSRFTFPIVWSFFIVLSYSAYGNPNYTEQGVLLIIEYAVVLSWLFLEVVKPGLIHSWNRKIWGETP